MDVRLSPEQQALRSSAAQVVDRLAPAAVGNLDDRKRIADLESAVVQSGWRELRTPDETGRPWASAVEVALVAEELGRGPADVAFFGPTLAAELRRLAGAPPAEQAETVVLLPDLAGIARPDDAGVAVDAAGAARALVVAPGTRGFTLASVPVLVPVHPGGVDVTRPSVAVSTARRATVTAARPIGEEQLTAFVALGLAIACADLVGVMRGAIALASTYAKARAQFGRPIGSFQALQHLLADCVVHLEGSRSATLHAAWSVDALEPAEALAAASLAKASTARAAKTVCENAVQVHGGIGHTWECMAHVYLRRALVSIDAFGGVGANLDRVLAHAGVGGS